MAQDTTHKQGTLQQGDKVNEHKAMNKINEC